MLGKIASAGQNVAVPHPSPRRSNGEDDPPTPADRHLRPRLRDLRILVAAGEYLRENHQAEIFADEAARKRFSEEMALISIPPCSASGA